jgi:hypothetical protein
VSGNATVRHNVGTCPACRGFLWADVEIEVSIGEPTITHEGRAHVYATPRMVSMAVAHSCWRDEDGEVHTRELGDLGDLAEAWDEGWRAAWSPMSPRSLNNGQDPYRTEADAQ